MPSRQQSSAIVTFAAQVIKHDADFFFRRILLARRPANVANQPLRGALASAARWILGRGFPNHLRSFQSLR